MTRPILSKYNRDPNYAAVRRVAGHQITPTSLAIIDTIDRYRFIPTSLLFRLIAGDRRNLYYHLQALYHKHHLINRLVLFDLRGFPEEFVYYLDSPHALELLAEHGVREADDLDFERLSHGGTEASEGHHLFVRHELMISRLRAMLELACSASGDEVILADFKQGPDLHSTVRTPGLGYKSEVIRGQRRKMLYETGQPESIPHRPDAFFTLQFPSRADNQQQSSFYYEADRKTTDTTRMIKKFRGHFHSIVKRKNHQARLQAPSIRAVLIETLDTDWAETLRQAAAHPAVSGPKASNLFWFTSSQYFTEQITAQQGGKPKQIPYYYQHPDVILSKLWFSPNDREGDRPRSILDP